MKKRELKDLPYMELSPEKEMVNIETIKNVMRRYGADCVYFVHDGLLWGMVAVGDILRASDKKVKIQRKFSALGEWQYIAAKKILAEHKNFFTLPVTNSDKRLIGDYYRIDDMTYFDENHHFLKNAERSFLEKLLRKNQSENVFLVKPLSEKRIDIYHKFAKCLDAFRIEYQALEYTSIPAHFQDSPCFIFATVEELRCVQALLQNHLDVLDVFHMTIWRYATLIDNFIKANGRSESAKRYYDAVFERKDDVTVILINNDNLQTYCSNLGEVKPYIQNIPEKDWEFFDVKLYEGNAEKIFCDNFSEEYWKTIGENVQKQIDRYRFHAATDLINRLKTVPKIYRKTIISQNQGNMTNNLEDIASPYMNVTNGIRRTVGQPEEYERTIYFFGTCVVVGALVEDKNTLESILQKRLNEDGIKCRVVNFGSFGDENFEMMWNRIMGLDLRKGDILVLYKYEYHDERFASMNLPEVAAEARIPLAWMTDSLAHCNHKAYAVYAEKLYGLLKEKLQLPLGDVSKTFRMDWRPYFLRKSYFERFFADTHLSHYKNIGCAVISADPFTTGTRYLIEHALKETDCVIVFIRAEKASPLLPLAERLSAARECLKDLKNVFVVRTTTARYALKMNEERDFVEACFEQRASWFAEFIAKPLGIRKRFFGEEPEDEVENSYNMALKRILPKYGIEAKEISRLKGADGTYISATRVRTHMQECRQEKAFDFMPEAMRKFF